MTERNKLRPCPCGEPAYWYRGPSDPELAPEHAVCFLTDADFADDLCDACFDKMCRDGAITPLEKTAWKRVSSLSSRD